MQDRKLISKQGVAGPFFQDKKSDASEELSYGGSENKLLKAKNDSTLYPFKPILILFFQRKTLK